MISAEQLVVRAGGTCIAGPLSFSAAAGDTVALCGPSGSGKSTILAALLGLSGGHEGQITVADLALSPGSAHALRAKCAYVPQEPLFQGRTLEEALFAPFDFAINRSRPAPVDAAKSLLDRMGLGALDFGHAIDALSGGEKQRVAIASALLLERPVLLMDEPASALDRDTAIRVGDLIPSETLLICACHEPAGCPRTPDQVLSLGGGRGS